MRRLEINCFISMKMSEMESVFQIFFRVRHRAEPYGSPEVVSFATASIIGCSRHGGTLGEDDDYLPVFVIDFGS